MARCKRLPAAIHQATQGTEGTATKASLNEPHGLCFYGEDILLICDHYNSRIKAVKLLKSVNRTLLAGDTYLKLRLERVDSFAVTNLVSISA